jgi:hypothetical protein
VVCERAYWAFAVRMRDTTGRYTEQSKLDLAGAGFINKDQPELKKSMQNPILTCRPVLNTSVLLQRARILVPAIAQSLTRRPVARPARPGSACLCPKAARHSTLRNKVQRMQSSVRFPKPPATPCGTVRGWVSASNANGKHR